MNPDRAAYIPRIGLLLRFKCQALRNRVAQAVEEAPLRVATTVVLTGVIWVGLYQMFRLVFVQLDRTPLAATVAIPLIFNYFFVAMLAMLTFSNAIIAYGALFGKSESTYLLTAPVSPRDLVTLKYIESLVISSWSLILLGLPLMMAMANTVTSSVDETAFSILFLAFFITFVPIPGALGMGLAWLAARCFGRRALRWVVGLAAGALVTAILFCMSNVQSLQLGDVALQSWLRDFLDRMSFVESVLLPNYWVAEGIDCALNERMGEAVLFLCVTAANGLFLSWLVVNVVSSYFEAALDHALSAGGGGRRVASRAAGGVAGNLFLYLPRPLRLIAAKDLRTFLRDPMQWCQLVILFGLMVLYLPNIPTLRLELGGVPWALAIPFLNLCAISLILATFTCRFVFPLVSLEGHQLWLVGLLPMPRGRVLWAKFAFAMTITIGVALGAMAIAAVLLKLPTAWTLIHLCVTLAICVGLCGFSVGIGARLPMFDQLNSARIANGLGGTLNLLASIALVGVMLVAVAWATWRSRFLQSHEIPDTGSLVLCGGACLVGVVAGAWAMRVGARQFERAEV